MLCPSKPTQPLATLHLDLSRGPSCKGPYWAYSPWTACNVTCGGGTVTRVASCEGAASARGCKGAPQQPLEQACNTAACDVFAWRADEWAACTRECGGERAALGV